MADTISAGKSAQETIARIQARKLGLHNASVDIADVRTYVDEYTKISKVNNWDSMSGSTVLGADIGSAATQGLIFDGRYVYNVPYTVNTFARFDTQGQFAVVGDWEKISTSTAGGQTIGSSAFSGGVYDGRYVYYAANNSPRFVRFDTRGVFTVAGNWESITMSTAQGAADLNNAYSGATFDGRYVYFSAYVSDTFLRFDTQGTSFSTIDDWETMSRSTAFGAVVTGAVCRGNPSFDGRYVYFSLDAADTFLRFDTQGTSFTTTADWQKMDMSTAQGAAPVNVGYYGTVFDGRYIYYIPVNSDTFLRFDTQGTSWTTAAAWEQMSMSTAQGVVLDSAFRGASFDGRYILYASFDSDSFLKFDTQGTSFTTVADWTTVFQSTVQGGALVNTAYDGIVYDGKYTYFAPYTADTFLRVLACPKAYNNK